MGVGVIGGVYLRQRGHGSGDKIARLVEEHGVAVTDARYAIVQIIDDLAQLAEARGLVLVGKLQQSADADIAVDLVNRLHLLNNRFTLFVQQLALDQLLALFLGEGFDSLRAESSEE